MTKKNGIKLSVAVWITFTTLDKTEFKKNVMYSYARWGKSVVLIHSNKIMIKNCTSVVHMGNVIAFTNIKYSFI